MKRISDIGTFSTCELQALRSVPEPNRRRIQPVATWVGTAAHARLAGEPMPELGTLAYDATTRNAHEARADAQRLAEVADAALGEAGLRIAATEVEVNYYLSGHIDLLLRDEQDRLLIGELKTSFRAARSAWLQMGGYLQQWQEGGNERIHGLVLVVAPRLITRPAFTRECHVERRDDVTALEFAWHTWFHRALDLRAGRAHPLARAGTHCRWCTVPDCAVRAVQEGAP